MADPTFQQKKEWARGKNLGPAPVKPSWIQNLWASTPGRLVQGSLIDDAMGLAQMAVRMEEPVIPLRMGQPDPYRDAAVNAVDGWVSDVERNYRDARIAAGQDVTGVDWVRGTGGLLPSTPFSKVRVATSLGGKVFQRGVSEFGESLLTDSVNTENGNSYGREKLGSATMSAAVGAAFPFAGAGLAKIVDPKISAGTRRLLDQGVPLTVGQTLGGATQRLENTLASLPVVGAPIRAAQERGMEAAYPGLMRTLNASGDSAPDLRPLPRPVAIDRGATGFMADMAYSQPVQTALRTVVGSERPQAAGIIGDYLRDEIGLPTMVRGLLSGPR